MATPGEVIASTNNMELESVVASSSVVATYAEKLKNVQPKSRPSSQDEDTECDHDVKTEAGRKKDPKDKTQDAQAAATCSKEKRKDKVKSDNGDDNKEISKEQIKIFDNKTYVEAPIPTSNPWLKRNAPDKAVAG